MTQTHLNQFITSPAARTHAIRHPWRAPKCWAVFAVLMVGAAAAVAADPPVKGSPDQDPDPTRALPFAFTVKTLPWGGPGKADFPKPFFLVDKEMALISCAANGVLLKGSTADQMNPWARIELTGEMLKPRTDNLCVSGAWYDRETKTIYAVVHCEVHENVDRGAKPSNPGWCRKKTALVKSSDQGKTWHGAGDLLTAPYMDLDYDWLMYSGADFEAGPADFEMYVDERGGYAYITSWNSYVPKDGGMNGCLMFTEVARCALSDKLAAGKWFKFRDGKWEEPGLGGKASRVRFDRRGIYGSTIYSTFLKRYLRVGVHTGVSDDRGMPANGFRDRSLYISSCTDLGKQDWSPMAKLLNDPASKDIMCAVNLTNGEGTDPYTCGDTLRVYNYWENAARRIDVTLKKDGTMPSTYFPPHDSYGYHPHWESGDPIEGRRTRIIGAASPEMRYTGGGWKEVNNSGYYQGLVKTSATAGDSVEFNFTGADIYWRAVADKDGGKAEVFIDGTLEKTVDCFFWDCALPFQFAFIKTGLDPKKPHTIKVVVKGDQNAHATGAMIRHMAFEHAAEIWTASVNFSSVQGKDQWTYRSRRPDGTFINMTYPVPGKFQWRSEDGGVIHAGESLPVRDDVVRSWKAPREGSVRIQGPARLVGGTVSWDPSLRYVESEDSAPNQTLPPTHVPLKLGSSDLDVAIMHNERQVWSTTLTYDGAGRLGANNPIDLLVPVKRGDQLHFVVSRKKNDEVKK